MSTVMVRESDCDFETFSEIDVTEVGSPVYSEHPSTEVLCFSYKIEDSETVLWHPGLPLSVMQPFFDFIAEGGLIWAHNVFFERMIWENVCVKRMGWPAINAKQYRCVAALASSYSLPRALEKCGKALKLDIIKDMDGKRAMQQLSKPRRPSKKNPDNRWTKEKYPEKYETLYDYNKTDVEAEYAIKQCLGRLTKTERIVWQVDQAINARGMYMDEDLIDSAMIVATEKKKRLNEELNVLTKGVVSAATQTDRLKKWLIKGGTDLENMQKPTLKEILEDKNIRRSARRAIEIRLSVSKASVKKYDKMKMCLCADGRIRDHIMFHGAGTGRFAGKFVQPHNFARGTLKDPDTCVDVIKMQNVEFIDMLYDNTMEALSSCLRGAICAAPGHELIVADYASIEARVLLWLAYDEKGLDIFREGKDIYVDMASSIYNMPTSKVSKTQRQLGKTAILGLGFQMGWLKFIDTCADRGIELEEDTAKEVVNKYRRKYKSVKRLWYKTEEAAVKAMRTGRAIQCGRVIYFMDGRFLHCKLPSKRTIKYCDPKLRRVITPWGEEKDQIYFMGTNSVTKQWCRQNTYGGKLVENFTQAIARDLLTNALVKCENHPIYKPVLHVHDEIIAEVPKGLGNVKEFEDLISILPDWAEGIPLVAEGFRSNRYRKG